MTTTDFVWVSSLLLSFLFGYLMGLRDKNSFWKRHAEDLSRQVERMKAAGIVDKAVSHVEFNPFPVDVNNPPPAGGKSE